jgi:hypothetical protein
MRRLLNSLRPSPRKKPISTGEDDHGDRGVDLGIEERWEQPFKQFRSTLRCACLDDSVSMCGCAPLFRSTRRRTRHDTPPEGRNIVNVDY